MEGFDTYILLADEIGEETAKKVFALFAGDRVSFPKKVSLFFRDLEIVKRFEVGESYEDLARVFSLSPQQIRHITSRKSRESQQQIKIELIN